MKETYFETVMMVERLHRLFLDVVKNELDRRSLVDINNVQCFILYNIGDNKLTVGEVSNRGYYLGSNVTYNLKKMIDNGYVKQEQSPHDKRSSYVMLTQKGMDLFKKMDSVFEDHTKSLRHNGFLEQDLKSLKSLLQRLESFWSFTANFEKRL